jgi:hypothetical protein
MSGGSWPEKASELCILSVSYQESRSGFLND